MPSEVAPLDAGCGEAAANDAAAAAVSGAESPVGSHGGFSSVLLRRLQALHQRYGEFAEENGYVRCEDKEVCARMRLVQAELHVLWLATFVF